MLIPISLISRHIRPQHLLNSTIGSLGLAVGLRMVRGRHGRISTESIHDVLPEGACEPRVAVRNNHSRHAVQAHDMINEKLSQLGSIDVSRRRNEVGHLGKTIDDGDDRVMARRRLGELGDEVHGDLLPVVVRYR